METNYKEMIEKVVERFKSTSTYVGCTDGSEEMAFFAYRDIKEKFKNAINDKEWVLVGCDDEKLSGVGYTEELHQYITHCRYYKTKLFEVK